MKARKHDPLGSRLIRTVRHGAPSDATATVRQRKPPSASGHASAIKFAYNLRAHLRRD
jgi:hypothetical protein